MRVKILKIEYLFSIKQWWKEKFSLANLCLLIWVIIMVEMSHSFNNVILSYCCRTLDDYIFWVDRCPRKNTRRNSFVIGISFFILLWDSFCTTSLDTLFDQILGCSWDPGILIFKHCEDCWLIEIGLLDVHGFSLRIADTNERLRKKLFQCFHEN